MEEVDNNSPGIFANIKSFFQQKEPVLELVAEPKPKQEPIKPDVEYRPPRELNHENLDAVIMAIRAANESDEEPKKKLTLKEFLEG